MTDSPINLDEAHGIIAVSKSRHAGGNGTTTDIDYRYLERIISELEAGRERIARSEALVNDPAFTTAIIPQAEDAARLTELESWMSSQRDDAEAEGIDTSFIDEQLSVVRRYLAAIEGGQP